MSVYNEGVRTSPDLLWPILLDPTDDVCRLVYADWLEEHGETARAGFIRVQIELAQLAACEHQGRVLEDGSPWPACRSLPADARPEPPCPPCQRWRALRSQERQLAACGQAWWRSDGLAAVMPLLAGPTLDDLPTWHAVEPRRPDPRFRIEAQRGFIHRVHCRLLDWTGGVCRCSSNDYERLTSLLGKCPLCENGVVAGYGPAIVAAYPVGELVLTDLPRMVLAGGVKENHIEFQLTAGDITVKRLVADEVWFAQDDYHAMNYPPLAQDVGRAHLNRARATVGLPPLV